MRHIVDESNAKEGSGLLTPDHQGISDLTNNDEPRVEIQSVVGKVTPGRQPQIKTESVTLDDALARAMDLHQKGRQAEAESLYSAILNADPKHPTALHFSGILSFQNSAHQKAIELIEQALKCDPNYVDARNNLGNIYHELRQFKKAENAYRAVLDISPTHAGAINNLAAVLKARGNFEEALTCYQSALELDPDNAVFHYNLGNAYTSNQLWQEAKTAYQRSIELKSDNPAAYRELGSVLRALGEKDASLKAISQAVELDESHAGAHCEHGIALQSTGLLEDAVLAYQRAIAADPKFNRTYPNLVVALKHLNRMQEAEDFAKRWLEINPENATANHMLASITGLNVPARATDSYVTELFDNFSTQFDEKLQQLEYKAPQLILDHSLKAGVINVDKPCRIIDAGCGTGLCGPLFRAYASTLDGVDLSAGMLNGAKLRNVYDHLAQAELTAYLENSNDDCDIIISADTLVYFGDLGQVTAASSQRLVPGGWLVFSIEKLKPDESQSPHQLNPHGRYSHSEIYVRETLSTHGFNNVSITDAVLRQELGEPVNGFIVLAQNS